MLTSLESSFCFILVRPQMGENIGAAARAMANFGISDMRLVAPRDGWPNDRAISLASKAFDGYVQVRVFDTLAEAMEGVHYAYATTARRRDLEKPGFSPKEAVEHGAARAANIAIIFGPERTGLENNEISECQALIHIPTMEGFSSLNLGQSALLMGYEIMLNSLGPTPPALSRPLSSVAPYEQFEFMFTRLQTTLEDRDFFKEASLKPTILKNIKTMFMRAEMSEQEIKTFHGILSALAGKL